MIHLFYTWGQLKYCTCIEFQRYWKLYYFIIYCYPRFEQSLNVHNKTFYIIILSILYVNLTLIGFWTLNRLIFLKKFHNVPIIWYKKWSSSTRCHRAWGRCAATGFNRKRISSNISDFSNRNEPHLEISIHQRFSGNLSWLSIWKPRRDSRRTFISACCDNLERPHSSRGDTCSNLSLEPVDPFDHLWILSTWPDHLLHPGRFPWEFLASDVERWRRGTRSRSVFSRS